MKDVASVAAFTDFRLLRNQSKEDKGQEGILEIEGPVTWSCARLRPLVLRGGALSARYFSFSSSLTRISCSNSSLAFATIRLCTHVNWRIITTQRFTLSLHARWRCSAHQINPSIATHTMTSAALLWSNTCITISLGRKKIGQDPSYLEHQLPGSRDLWFPLGGDIIQERKSPKKNFKYMYFTCNTIWIVSPSIIIKGFFVCFKH